MVVAVSGVDKELDFVSGHELDQEGAEQISADMLGRSLDDGDLRGDGCCAHQEAAGPIGAATSASEESTEAMTFVLRKQRPGPHRRAGTPAAARRRLAPDSRPALVQAIYRQESLRCRNSLHFMTPEMVLCNGGRDLAGTEPVGGERSSRSTTAVNCKIFPARLAISARVLQSTANGVTTGDSPAGAVSELYACPTPRLRPLAVAGLT
jgi:hypothetical protein